MNTGRASLLLMGTAHLLITLAIGVGVGFYISRNVLDDTSKGTVERSSIDLNDSTAFAESPLEEFVGGSSAVTLHRRTAALSPIAAAGASLLRGKIDPEPTPSWGGDGHYRPSSRGTPSPSVTSTEHPTNEPSRSDPLSPAPFVATGYPTFVESTLSPVDASKAAVTPSPSTSMAVLDEPTDAPTAASSREPSSIPTAVVRTGTHTNVPTQSDESVVESNLPTHEPLTDGVATEHPTLKCTCAPTPVDEEIPATPTLDASTSGPTPSDDGTCEPIFEEACCSQHLSKPEADRELVCLELGCSLSECPAPCRPNADALPTFTPTFYDVITTSIPTASPAITFELTHHPTEETASPTTAEKRTCKPTYEEVCCNQPASASDDDKDRVCQELGCTLEECSEKLTPTLRPSFATINVEPPAGSPTNVPTPFPSSASPTTFESSADPTSQPTDEPTSSSPTVSPSHEPTDEPTSSSPTQSPSDNPTDEPTSANPTDSPSDKPTVVTSSPSANPSSEPPYYTWLPTKVPSTRPLDTLRPTTLFPTANPVAVGELATSRPTNEPSAGSTPGSTPTVSKETTAPPTMYARRPVYKSKIETSCSPVNEELGGALLQGLCTLYCTETTQLYEGDVLLRETSKLFEAECPDDDVDRNESFVRTIEHTIRNGPLSSYAHANDVETRRKESPYRVFAASEDESEDWTEALDAGGEYGSAVTSEGKASEPESEAGDLAVTSESIGDDYYHDY